MPANVYGKNIDAAFRVYDVTEEETLDIENACVKVFDDFARKAVDTTNLWTFAAVNSGAVAITVAAGGVARITTGGADDDDADLASDLIWDPTKGLVLEARVANNDVSATGMFIGFTDAQGEAADTIAMTYATTELTTTASDAAGFVADSDATTYTVLGCSVKANVDGAVNVSSVAPADAEYHTYRVEIDTDQTARFYVDGDLIGTNAAAVTSTVKLCAYVGFINREGAANTLDIDYIRVAQIQR